MLTAPPLESPDLTTAFCDISFALAHTVVYRPFDRRAVEACIAWLNASAFVRGCPWHVVSENCVSGMLH